MSKATSDPFVLGGDNSTQTTQTAQQGAANDPFVLGGVPRGTSISKKKDGDTASGAASTTSSTGGGNGLSVSPSGSQSPSAQNPQLRSDPNLDKAIQNWNNKTLTGDDVQVMSKYRQGLQLGFNNLTKSGMDRYARSHNAGSIQDVANKAKSITDQWTPLLKADNKTPFSLQLKDQNPDLQIDGLARQVSSGDPDAIYAFKDKVVSNLQGQIDAMGKKNTAQALQNSSVVDAFAAAGAGGTYSAKKTSAEDKAKIDQLNKQIEDVKRTYDDYASTSLVNTARQMPGGITQSSNLMWVGRNLRRLSQSPTDFKTQQNIPHDSNAATERNYLDERAGYDAAIEALSKMQGEDFTNAVHTRSDQLRTAADLRSQELNRMVEKRNSLSQKYLPVDVYNTSRVIGDKLSEIHGAPVAYHSGNEIRYAIDQIQKDDPDFYKAHQDALKFITAHPSEVPLQGFFGGVQRGVQPPEWLERLTTGKSRAEQDIEDQFSAVQTGTSYAGKTPTKVVLDNQGKEFVEKPNENYGNANFNSVVGNMGEFSGNMVVYGLLTEGAGELVGAGTSATAKLVGKGFEASDRVKQLSGLAGSTYLLNYDNNLKVANGLINDESGHGDFKKSLVANLMTLGQAAAMSILPANQFLRNNFTKIMGSDALGVLASDNADALTKDLTKSFMDKVKTRALSVLNEAKELGIQTGKADAEMVLTNHINDIIESTFDEKGNRKNDVLQQDINTIRDVTLGSLAFGLPRMAKSALPMNYRDALYDAAIHADENIARITQLQEDGTIDREKANGIIKLIKTAKDHLPTVLSARTGDETDPEAEGAGLPLSTRQKKQMLAEKVRASIAGDHSDENPEDLELKRAQSQANSAYNQTKKDVPYEPTQPTSEGSETAQTETPQDQTETTKGKSSQNQEESVNSEDRITVREMLDRQGTYKGIKGQFYQDGQTVVFKEEGRQREHELGNIDEIANDSIKDYGIDQLNSVVKANAQGDITVRGKKYINNYSDPLAAINRDEEGNVVSVNLETEDGQKRTFRGDVAEDIAYQIHLKAISDGNQGDEFEQHINNDEGARKAVEDAGLPENIPQGRPENIGQVQRTTIKKQEPIKSNKNEKVGAKQEGPQADQGRERGQSRSLEGKENGDEGRPPGEKEDVLAEKGPAEAEPEEVGPSQLAKEQRENHLEAIRTLEQKEDRISDKDLEDPSRVKDSVLRNIAAKELGHETLTDAEQKVAEARRGDIDEIKVEDKAKRSDSRMSDEDRKRRDELKRKIQLIDKFGHEDIIKHLIDNGIIKPDC